ncbi:S-adenosyl-L-methionine-dependent methyltransferase [Pseudovirgaria hyperparasitica]|uniref:S-adenosyl-L-methionine-dependent methyltransferase n=1 Tax=Pseudovirgaria hyperparasitica TaxID=470096 RepID=A0A6A6W7I8_9PEZI|nr:S-adenosyl-L-methionine-dependent methyltransferase [Pseudovirgaria hyperparasitica]KAF2757846.1 S-adenosyl-L-methionine-dependent methyltransferase [Pseudovirgaria hyperparasitica]
MAAPKSYADIAATINHALANLPAPGEGNMAERYQLLGAIDRLKAAVEPPEFALQRMNCGAHSLVAMRIAVGMGIFDALPSHVGEEISFDDLASQTKGSPDLLERILRLLKTHNIITSPRPNHFAPLPLALSLTSPSPSAYSVIHFYSHLKSQAHIYEYLSSTSFATPSSVSSGPWQYALSTRKPYQEWLKADPLQQRAFNETMTSFNAFRLSHWHDTYPVHTLVPAPPSSTPSPSPTSSPPLLVDIGAGLGSDALAFRARFPDLPGPVILQDLPAVVSSITTPLPPGILVLGHDMFAPQPPIARHARAYYLRSVLVDWPDAQVLQVLRHVRDAMGPESVVLVNEYLMPEEEEGERVGNAVAAIDLIQMSLFGGLVRTERQWGDVVRRAGLRVKKVWRTDRGGPIPTGVVECVLEDGEKEEEEEVL